MAERFLRVLRHDGNKMFEMNLSGDDSVSLVRSGAADAFSYDIVIERAAPVVPDDTATIEEVLEDIGSAAVRTPRKTIAPTPNAPRPKPRKKPAAKKEK